MSIHDETIQSISIPTTVLQATAKAVFERLTPGNAGTEMGRACDRLRTRNRWSNEDLRKLRELVRDEVLKNDALQTVSDVFGK